MRYVPEVTDELLALFPHRWDYIYSPHGQQPSWVTENRHPLSDRMIGQRAYLYGVRFGAETSYAVIDIDRKSIYHPTSDRFAVSKIMEAIAHLGITDYLAVTSSYSGGLHLYLPLAAPCKSWEIAAALHHALDSKGYQVAEGQLEIFPNQRNYDPETTTLYKAHRLPLQPGCYILNPDWQQCHTTATEFLRRWHWCCDRNHLDRKSIDAELRKARKSRKSFTHKASKFLNDLNACIDAGWSEFGQTNFILGRIALREYIFGHIIEGLIDPIVGDRLILRMAKVAQQLPGYTEWCRHHNDLLKRCEEWARCVENSRYWPYKQKPLTEGIADDNLERPGADPSAKAHREPNYWNQFQQKLAREKITQAIAQLLNEGTLPAGARDRFCLLASQFNLGGETLYRHRDLWHPDCLWNTPPEPPQRESLGQGTGLEAVPMPQAAPSLFVSVGGDRPTREGYRQFLDEIFAEVGGNTPLQGALSDSEVRLDSG